MAKFYTPFFVLSLGLLSLSVSARVSGNPDPDSLSGKGHCKTVIVIDTLCGTNELSLSAFIDWTWTSVHEPVVVIWSTGIQAHKINVVPPGTWSWNSNVSTCEPWHWQNEATIEDTFFDGPIEISGPDALCPTDAFIELNLITNGYTDFTDIVWSPANPTGEIEPYEVSQAGNYGITVTDAFGCTSSDHVSILDIPAFTPSLTGPVRICPEADTAMLALVNPGSYTTYEWTTGETTTPITVTEPGYYTLTATDSHGCTGEGSISVQSGAVDPFAISVTTDTLCPAQSDTLRVVGGYSSYAWSNNVNGITNIVNQAGTYTVTVTNVYGCSGTSSTTVVPLLPPLIQVASTPLCLGDSAVLTTLGGSFVQYEWSSGQTTATISATAPGTYTVTVSGGGICATSTSTVLDFAQAPVTLIDLPGALTCLQQQITLNGSSSSSGPNFPLHWTTPDGHFVSGENTLNPVVDQPGTYILSIVNTNTGCVTNDTVVVTQDIAQPLASAGTPDTLTCTVQNFAIGPVPAPADPNLLPIWSTSNGNIFSGNDTWSPEIDQPGTYLLTVTYAVNGCTNTSSVVIEEDILSPSVQITPTELITCMQGTVSLDGSGSSSGPGITYAWSTANGLISGPNTAAICGAESIGTYDLLITNTQNGCTASASANVAADVNIPNVSALPPATLNCLVNSTLIDASASSSGPGFQYNWSSANGSIQSGGNTLTPTVSAPGTYTLNLLNTANDCAATLAVVVNQDIAAPSANAGADAVLNCALPSTILDGSASSTGSNFIYQWSSADGNILSGDDSLNPVVDMEGTYFLEVTDQNNGCTSSASVVILDDANAPTALIAAPATLTCVLQQTVIDAGASTQTGNLSYVWSGNISTGQGSLQATVNQPGVYTLTVTNNDNGCTDAASVTVIQDILSPAAEAGANGLLNCFHPTGSIGSLSNPSGAGFTLQWTTTGGHFIAPVDGPTTLIDQAGDYQLLITNTQNGCTATDNVSVSADFTAPLADAGPTNELTCVQTALNLQGSGSTGPIFNYLWTTTAGGNIVNGANSLTPVVDAPGNYQLLVSNSQNGCTALSQVDITENANGPLAVAGTPQTLTCTFTSTTLNGTGSSAGPEFVYAWSSPDGNFISGAGSLTPGVDAPGTYILTVTNTSNLCTETASVTILENIQQPVVNAGPDNSLNCLITNLTLQAQIVSAASTNIDYQWFTPDGQIIGGGNTAAPVIGAPGTYWVTVTDALNGCAGTDQIQITQDITPPTVVINNPETLTCAVQTVTLQAGASSTGSNFMYAWSTTLGHFVSTQNPQQPAVDEPGAYHLLITNTSNGCTQTANVTVPQDVQLPIADAGASVGLDCDTQTNILDAAASSQGANFIYSWSTTGGQIISGDNTLHPVIGDPGSYVLSVLNTQNGCSELAEVVVTEDVQHPVLAIAPPQTLNCNLQAVTLSGSGTDLGNPSSISWTSSAGGNIVSGGNTLQPVVDAPGNYQLMVLNPANGCSSSLPATVVEDVQAPPVQVQPAPLLTCSVLQFPLQSTIPAQASVVWTTSNGHIVSGANTSNPVVDQAGLYQVNVTSGVNGCTNSANIVVQQELNIPTGLHFKLEPPLCNGTPGVLTVDQVNGGVGPFAYSVDGGQTFFPSEAFTQITPGNYDVVIQDLNGCEVTQPVLVPSPPIPLVTAPPGFEIELGENQELQANVPLPFPLALVDTVIWSPMDGLTFAGNSTLQLLNPIAGPYHTTQYSVTIVTKEGCTSTARTIVKVDREADIYAPNVIWPEDPDGNNNTFLIFARDESIAIIKKLQIFDRWGSLIFVNQDIRPNDSSAGWAGDYRGVPVNPAVFVWWAEVELVDGRELLIKGDVTVLR